jgi:hypothetical protein
VIGLGPPRLEGRLLALLGSRIAQADD